MVRSPVRTDNPRALVSGSQTMHADVQTDEPCSIYHRLEIPHSYYQNSYFRRSRYFSRNKGTRCINIMHMKHY